MFLRELDICRLRNIEHIHLDVEPGINWFVGKNGAGKTSVLESIFLLSRGRSFRSRKFGSPIRRGEQSLSVRGLVRDAEGACAAIQYRLQGNTGGGLYWEKGVKTDRLAGGGSPIFVRIIGDNAQRLLDGEPRLRRLFLDWNLFHVEPSYAEVLRAFRRVRAQRAAWLRAGGKGKAVWDVPFAVYAERVTERRAEVLSRIERYCNEIDLPLPERSALRLAFVRGWPEGAPLVEILARTRDSDTRRGFTYYGPDRADFRVEVGGLAVVPSRGEAKLLTCALQVAAQRLWDAEAGPRSIWLLDDLVAELDEGSAGAVIELLPGAGGQIFATSLIGDALSRRIFAPRAVAMFHVEHGTASPADRLSE